MTTPRKKRIVHLSQWMFRKLRLERDEAMDDIQRQFDRKVAGISEEITTILAKEPHGLTLRGLREAFEKEKLYWDYNKCLFAIDRLRAYRIIVIDRRNALYDRLFLSPDPPPEAAECFKEPEPLYALNPCGVCGERFTVARPQAVGVARYCRPPKPCRIIGKHHKDRELHQRRREAAVR